MGMIQTDDFVIRHSKDCPPGIDLDITFQKELSIFINGSVYDLITSTQCDVFSLPSSV